MGLVGLMSCGTRSLAYGLSALVDGSIGPAIRGRRPSRGMWRCTTLAVVFAIAVSGGLRGQIERLFEGARHQARRRGTAR